MDPALIFPALTAAISVLFWQLMKEKDRQIERLEDENKEKEAKIEKLNDIVTKNTDSLTDTATALNTVAGILANQQPPPSRSTATVTDPTQISGGR